MRAQRQMDLRKPLGNRANRLLRVDRRWDSAGEDVIVGITDGARDCVRASARSPRAHATSGTQIAMRRRGAASNWRGPGGNRLAAGRNAPT